MVLLFEDMKITLALSDYFLRLKNINEDVHEFQFCQEIGCSKMELEYEASDDQLKSLVERSTECEQSISIDCVNSPLKVLNNAEMAWWTDLNGKPRLILKQFLFLVHCMASSRIDLVDPSLSLF